MTLEEFANSYPMPFKMYWLGNDGHNHQAEITNSDMRNKVIDDFGHLIFTRAEIVFKSTIIGFRNPNEKSAKESVWITAKLLYYEHFPDEIKAVLVTEEL